jgi:hypothetical protein
LGPISRFGCCSQDRVRFGGIIWPCDTTSGRDEHRAGMFAVALKVEALSCREQVPWE